MRMINAVLFTIGIMCFGGTQSQNRNCDQNRINQCEEEFADDLGITRDDLEAGLSSDTTRDSLNDLCRAFRDFESCVRSSNRNCRTVEGLTDVYDYLCDEGFDDHVKYADCLSSDVVKPDILRCNEKIDSVSGRAVSESELCDVFKDSLECVEEAAEDHCGSDAADHQVEIDTRMWQPLADAFNCDLDEGTNIGLVVGVVVGLAVFIIICIAICYYCARRTNRRRFADQEQSMSMNGAPGHGHGEGQGQGQGHAVPYVVPGATAPPYSGPMAAPPAYNVYEDPDNLDTKKVPIFPSGQDNGSLPRKM